jgi:hypothetical protein
MDVAVGLVEGYLRLNGYLTVTELQVQREAKRRSGSFEAATDLDILAIRLPWAAETVARHPEVPELALPVDAVLDVDRSGPDVLIGEVKEGAARLNQALRTREVLHAALRRVGCCADDHIASSAEKLTRLGEVHLEPPHGLACRVRLASFAGRIDEPLPPGALSVGLAHVIWFIAGRFHDNRKILRGVQFHDPVLHTLRLLDKVGLDLAGGIGEVVGRGPG